VLVVDDEPLIGRSLRRILAPQHRVEVAGTVDEALQLLEEKPGGQGFGVILCDLMMPDRTGIDLYEELQRARPELAKRLVFMTGGAFTPKASEFLSHFAGRRLEKPMDAAVVRRVVADVLAWAA
ncbi:MAG TPA: response regulator, partial [Myxococcales bacterium]|nr:response regulator [Myxococcales bacterium]